MTTNQRNDVPIQWMTVSYLDSDQGLGEVINCNLKRFRHKVPPIHNLHGAVVAAFATPNATIEGWPQAVRVLLNKEGPDAKEPFNTWARPRDLDKRRRAIAVWSSMLAFVVSSWDFSSRDLHKMGLYLGDEMKALVDDIHFWCGLSGVKNFDRIRDAAKEFFHLAITDAEPSPRTNPLIWWMAVLVITQVLDNQPELPLGHPDKDFDPVLTFDEKLEALNHYARVLLLDSFIRQWKPSDYQQCTSFTPASSAILTKVTADLDSQDLIWLHEDRERPPTSAGDNRLTATPAWQECIAQLRNLINTWLVIDSRGPMREILSFSNGTMPSRSNPGREKPETGARQLSFEGATYEYKVMFQIWEEYTAGQGGFRHGFDGPATTGASSLGTYKSAETANEKAREAFKEELGSKFDARTWDESLRDDGTVMVRAVFIDFANNAKAVAWVEKQAATAGASMRT